MSSTTSRARRSTRNRSGAAAAAASGSNDPMLSSALQPVATNTPVSKKKKKKTTTTKTTKESKGGEGDKKSSSTATISSDYSLRKRAAGDGDDKDSGSSNAALAMVSHGSLYSDEDFEALLRRHEEDGRREREEKRRRLEGSHPYRPNPDGTIGNGGVSVALDQLPAPVITLVFEMLPRCRDVLRLACLSKYLMSYVERRTDLVVRAAVHENAMASIAPKAAKKRGGPGTDDADAPATDQQEEEQWLSSGAIGWSRNNKAGTSRKIVTQLAEDVRSRGLRVPSPLRLLRLLCAQTCERGERCWDFHAEQGIAGTRLGVDGAARPFGMALCHKCAADACRTVPRWWNHWGRTEEKILKIGGTKLFHPSATADLREGPGGESIGPFINARQVMQLSSSYRNDGIDTQKEAFGKLCEEVYGKEGDERYDLYEKAASQFVRYYDEAEEALGSFYAKHDDGKEDNRKKIVARKKETLVQIIPILEEAVEELPDNIKAMAMDYHWCDDDTQVPLRFSLPQVHQKLLTFIRAPSYASQKRVDDTVARIRDNLNAFASHSEFTSFSFLTAPSAEQQGGSVSDRQLKIRLRQKLLNHVQQKNLTDLATLLDKHDDPTQRWGFHTTDIFTPHFYDLLGRRSYTAALLYLLSLRGRGELDSVVAATTMVDGDALEAGNPLDHSNLISAIFQKIKAEEEYDAATSSFANFLNILKLCKTDYAKLSRAARDYLQSAPVVEYLAGAPDWGGGFTRQRAIGQVWRPQNSVLRGRYYHWGGGGSVPEGLNGLKPYQLLLERKFDKLLEVHRYYQRSGTSFGVH